MRFAEKVRFLQKSKEIQKKEEILTDYISEYSEQDVCSILTELQTEAIFLGNALEEQGVDKLVKKLEAYCEEIYQCSLIYNETKAILEHCQRICKLSEEIRADIEAIPVKIKIAFFPYKISMWDSLESIWEAANNDERCECKIVPIPYYTKNSEGEAEEKYYEGEAFAKSVPIIDYRKYFLEQEQPDIMYIHNPYDQYNKVTVVEERFFSKELKKNGGILVYVPYYISGYCGKYENMLTTCSTMGAVNSDFIIMQCENLKKAYEFCGFPEKRLLTLGNPKVDAVLKIAKKEYGVIEEWKPIIQDKKVILLNTSIYTSVQSNEWMKKIRALIEPILQDERLVLLWRPHPLLLDAVKVLIKEEKQYKELFEMITNAPNAIIDDSNSAQAAMKISDAMISDYSSLIMQYNFTGKPSYLLTGKSENRKYCIFCDYFSNYFREDGYSIEDFLEMVIAGIDEKKEERVLYAKKSMVNTDGTCGEKIHQEIYKKAIMGI